MDERISVHVFNALERGCNEKWALYAGVMDFHNIMFITKGSCDFYFDGKKRRLSEGDVVYFAKGTEREAKNHSPGTELICLDFDLFGCDRLPLPEVTHLNSFESFMPDFKNFFFAWYQKHDGYKLMCSGIFMTILSMLIYPNAQKKVNIHVSAMKEYIAEHLSETVTIDRIAGIVNLSPAYCGALFVRTEGMTIHEFINTLRINRAKDLLKNDLFTIAEVSSIVGYNDVFYFSKKFKQLTGASPSEYRRTHRK